MNVLNPDLLKSLRLPGLCEMCRKPCKMRCGHHVFSKGAGQVDHMLNLVSVAMNPVDGCNCHGSYHTTGKPSKMRFLEVISDREGVPIDVILEVIPAVRACPSMFLTFEPASAWLHKNFREPIAAQAADIIRRKFE